MAQTRARVLTSTIPRVSESITGFSRAILYHGALLLCRWAVYFDIWAILIG